MKGLAILGSTGSIGRQTLDVVRSNPGKLRVVCLAAGSNTQLLAHQIEEFHPDLVYCAQGATGLPADGRRLATMEEMAAHHDVDVVMAATVGRAGLKPVLTALNAGKNVALANKEVIIMAGGLVLAEARRSGAELLPVDSEPSAMWQCLRGEHEPIQKIVLTASGGPFRTVPIESLAHVTPQQALKHPTWRMGQRITVDSATLMNKGFEVIEASWLFGVPIENIEVVLHPQSIVHSMVEFADGSMKAQLGPADMRLPIQYALSYPERWSNSTLPRLDVIKTGKLTFEPLDIARYPAFGLALEAGRRGGTYPAVLAAADEVAVDRFLAGEIGFLDIPRVVEGALAAHKPAAKASLEDILDADAWAREHAAALARLQ